MATNFSPVSRVTCSKPIGQYCNAWHEGFYILASGVIQGHHGPLVTESSHDLTFYKVTNFELGEIESTCRQQINLLLNKPEFLPVCSTSLENWENDTILVMSNFSFFPSAFSVIIETFYYFHQI